MPTFKTKIKNNIATLTFDLANEKINKLTTPVMAEFEATLKDLKKDKSIKACLLVSAKKDIFIAGADIAEIQEIRDEKTAEKLAKKGQDIIGKIEDLPFPMIAVIDGACLGGGLELALACHYRIASDNPKTQLGLPEVNLGIIPGFGGTQRLPRLIGLQKSLEMILPGKSVDGKKAHKIHLVDAYAPVGFLMDHALALAEDANDEKKARKIRHKRRKKGLLETTLIGNALVFHTAKKNLMKQSKGHYPAPIAALNVIKKTYYGNLKKGLKKEARAFGKLAPSNISKNLIQLFFTSEALKKQGGTSKTKTETVYVLGAGLMGGGIAWALSNKEFTVRLKDISWPFIAKALETAAGIYKKALKRKKLKPHEINRKMGKITGTLTEEGIQNADLIIEAIPENIGLKKSVFKDLEPKLREDTIIASNTSALSITEMAKSLKSPERFIGMHFFSPVNRMPLVEVIPGKKTDTNTQNTIITLAQKMGKTPIVIKDCPGFLVNRILIPYVNEAIYLLEEGVQSTKIDALMEEFGMPIGPLSLADEVGLDVGIKVAEILEKGYGERMKPPALFTIIKSEPKLLGKKTGAGLFIHKGSYKSPNPKISTLIKEIRKTNPRRPDTKECIDRLILYMVNEATRCIDEKIVASPEFLDMAMIMGTGFPPFRGGLLKYADERGIPEIHDTLKALSEMVSPRFTPAPLLQKMAKSGKTFYPAK